MRKVHKMCFVVHTNFSGLAWCEVAAVTDTVEQTHLFQLTTCMLVCPSPSWWMQISNHLYSACFRLWPFTTKLQSCSREALEFIFRKWKGSFSWCLNHCLLFLGCEVSLCLTLHWITCWSGKTSLEDVWWVFWSLFLLRKWCCCRNDFPFNAVSLDYLSQEAKMLKTFYHRKQRG